MQDLHSIYTHRPKGDTTTLSGEAAVKPKNPKNLRGEAPSILLQQKGGSTVKSAAPFLLYAQISFVCFTSSMVLVPASCMVMDSSLLKWSNTDFTPSAPPRLRP